MQSAILDPVRPPMWRIESDGESRRYVRLGSHLIAVSDIAGVSLEEVRESQAAGLLMKGTAFMIAAAACAYYVFEADGRERFLIGAVFLGWLSATALIEAARIGSNSHYELTLTLKNGQRTIFSSHDRADVQALALRLAAEGAAATPG